MIDYELIEPNNGTSFPYSVEVEVDMRIQYPHINTLKKYQNIGGSDNVFDIIGDEYLRKSLKYQTPINDTYVVRGYNDGSVPYELVLASFNPYGLSKSVDEINTEIIITSAIGQHVSLKLDRKSYKWYEGINFLGVENLAMFLERSMVRKQGITVRSNYYWKYTSAPNYDDSNDKYTAVHFKVMKGDLFMEFRLHHPIPSPLVYFEFFPYFLESLSQKEITTLNMLKSPMANDEAYLKVFEIVENNMSYKQLRNLPLCLETD